MDCPGISVDAFVLNEHRELLLIQRANNGNWAMPGGGAEIGDTLAEAALRELWEEAGLCGEVKRLLGVYDNRLWGTTTRVHMLNLVFRVECRDLTPSPGVECLDARFCSREALPTLTLHPGHDTRIPAWFDALDGDVYFDRPDASGRAADT